MFCPNCGTENSEPALMCAKCGFNLKGASAPKFKGTMLQDRAQKPAAAKLRVAVDEVAAPFTADQEAKSETREREVNNASKSAEAATQEPKRVEDQEQERNEDKAKAEVEERERLAARERKEEQHKVTALATIALIVVDALAAFSVWGNIDGRYERSLNIAIGLGVFVAYPFLGALAAWAIKNIRDLAHVDPPESFDMETRYGVAIFWPIALPCALAWYPFYAILVRLY